MFSGNIGPARDRRCLKNEGILSHICSFSSKNRIFSLLETETREMIVSRNLKYGSFTGGYNIISLTSRVQDVSKCATV